MGFGEGGVLRLGVIASGRTSALATLALTSPFIVRASRSSPLEKSALAVSIHLSAIASW